MGLQRDPSLDSADSQARKVSGGSEGETIFSQTDATSTTAGESGETQSKPAIALWRANVSISEEPVKPFLPTRFSPKAAAATPESVSVLVPSLAADPALSQTLAPAPTLAPALIIKDEVKVKQDALKIARTKAERTASESPSKFSRKAAGKTESGPTSAKTTATAKEVTASHDTASAGANTAKTSVAKTAKPAAVATPNTAGHAAKTKAANSTKSKDAPKPAATSAKAKASKKAPKAITTTISKSEKRTVTAALKTPTSPSKSLTPKPHSKTPERKTPVPSERVPVSTPKSASSSTASRSTASSSSKKPSAVQTFPPNGVGFVKPKPRSPTRPVQLPAGLMTHTAASATKANVPRQTMSRQSGHYDIAHQPAARSSSRASIATVTASTPKSQRGLKRQNSTVNRPRPSIGPPPKQPARDHPVLKKEKDVDESFLARMMRPTQSSASKTADKPLVPQASPPRKQVATSPTRTVVRDKRHASASPSMKSASTPPPATPTPASDAGTLSPESTRSKTILSEKASPAAEKVVAKDASTVSEQVEPKSPTASECSPEAVQEVTSEPAVVEEAEPATADADHEEVTQDVELAQPESDISPESISLDVVDLKHEEAEVKDNEAVEATISVLEDAEPEVVVGDVTAAVEAEAVESI